MEAPEEEILRYLYKKILRSDNPYTTPVLKEAADDSYKRLIAPAIEREIRNELTEKAEDGAIQVFKKNLEQLLMQPPIVGQTVLGWDPAFRTGCKLAVVNPTGKVIGTTVIYPTAPTTPKKIQASKGSAEENYREISCYTDLSGERDSVPGIRAVHCGIVKGDFRRRCSM